MNYRERIREIFFTAGDLGRRWFSEDARLAHEHENTIAQGARSQLLMSHPVFQEAVTEMYLYLEAQLDAIEDTDPDSQDRIRWVRTQRRALRQVCAMLDNRIAQAENAEKQHQLDKEKVDES